MGKKHLLAAKCPKCGQLKVFLFIDRGVAYGFCRRCRRMVKATLKDVVDQVERDLAKLNQIQRLLKDANLI